MQSNRLSVAALHFRITSESNYSSGLKIHPFYLDVQTVTFPIPKDAFTLHKNRRFFVSASDGRITKDTGAVPLEGKALHWNETLDGL